MSEKVTKQILANRASVAAAAANILTKEAIEAIRCADIELLRRFLNDGVGLGRTQNGRTLLHYAIIHHANMAMLDLILSYKSIDINTVDSHYNTAFFLSIQRLNKFAAKYLVSKGVDVDERNKFGETTLIQLARQAVSRAVDFRLMVNLLLSLGADVKAVDNKGRSALHYVASMKTEHLDIVRSLMEAGADPKQLTDDGRSVLDYATTRPKKSMQLIRQLMGNHNIIDWKS